MASISSPPSYELLSTARYDPKLLELSWNKDSGEPSPFLILPYHYERLLHAADLHGVQLVSSVFQTYSEFKAASLMAVKATSGASNQPCRVRFTVSRSGVLNIGVTPTPPLSDLSTDPTSAAFFRPWDSNRGKIYGPIFTVRVDTQPTPTSLFTTTKTTQRQHYEAARARAGLPSVSSPEQPTEVVLFNQGGIVTEGSFSNIAFFDEAEGTWLTPRLATGCLPGIMRRWLLEEKRIRETTPQTDRRPKDLKDGTWVLIMNGLLGCRVGRIQIG